MAQRRNRTPEFAQNDKARLDLFQRRSRSLFKKASELSTHCDADVAVLVYADHLSDSPLVFPPESGESLRIVKKFKETRRSAPPDSEKYGDDIAGLNSDELNALIRNLEAKEAEVQRKIDAIKETKSETAVDKESDPDPTNHCLNVGEEAVEETSDPNCCFFSGVDRQSAMFEDNTPESKSEHLTEKISGLCNVMEEDEIETGFSNDLSGPNCFNGDEVEADSLSSVPRHLTENNNSSPDHVVSILDVEREEAMDESKIINEIRG